MTSGFGLVPLGDPAAEACVDGVCEVPPPSSPAPRIEAQIGPDVPR